MPRNIRGQFTKEVHKTKETAYEKGCLDTAEIMTEAFRKDVAQMLAEQREEDSIRADIYIERMRKRFIKEGSRQIIMGGIIGICVSIIILLWP
jgi:L-rhamnose isomerase